MYIKIENFKKELLVYIKICYMNKKIYSFFLNHLDGPKLMEILLFLLLAQKMHLGLYFI